MLTHSPGLDNQHNTHNMIVNFKCGSCNHVYNFEIGTPVLDKSFKLAFEINPVCPGCGARDKELLTEMGQSILTMWQMGEI